jgi:hypothetical protein
MSCLWQSSDGTELVIACFVVPSLVSNINMAMVNKIKTIHAPS